MVDELFNRAWLAPVAKEAEAVAHQAPDQPIDPATWHGLPMPEQIWD